MVVMKNLDAIRGAIRRFHLKMIDWEMLDGMYHVEVSKDGFLGLNHRTLILSASDYHDLVAEGVLHYQKNASAIQNRRFEMMLGDARMAD